MYQLSVGQDVQLTFDSGDLSRAGISLSDVIGRLLARQGASVGRALAFSCGGDGGSLGALGDVERGSGRSSSVVLAEVEEVRGFSGGVGIRSGAGCGGGGLGAAVEVVVEGREREGLSAGVGVERVFRGVQEREDVGGGRREVFGAFEEGVSCAEDGGGVVGELSSVGVCAESGGGVRGEKYVRNRKQRMQEKRRLERKRAAEKHRVEPVVVEEVLAGKEGVSEVFPEWRRTAGPKGELRESLEAKWKAENALKAAKAKKALALLETQDVGALAKLQRAKVQRATDSAMVQIEKDHAFLAKTGNVPELPGGGFCKTVVDGEGSSVPGLSGGTISPGSSISEKEVRAMMKELEDVKAELAELEVVKAELAVFKRGELVAGRLTRMAEGSVDFTVDGNGEIPVGVMEQAAEHFEGPEFLKVGPVVNGKRSLAFDREEFSYSGNYSKHYFEI